jgi:mono/diheme cytochrome c family protein
MRSARALAGILAAAALVVAGCGAAKVVSPSAETVIGTLAQETAPTVDTAKGDPAAGKALFTADAQPPCSSCHTYGPAGSNAQVGPDLDSALQGKDAEFVLESIVDPNKDIASGFQGGIMPGTYGEQLSQQQLSDLVAFLTQPSS